MQNAANEIIRLFRDDSLAPSQIDKRMRMPMGTSHDIIVQWWDWDKRFSEVRRRRM